ncbi:hypothetical protein BSKO_07450 [Bryopsis sp. KO-2023]|nr:hypothetical protein BSKO_07450 [Bryopsis sp. KO-2023]
MVDARLAALSLELRDQVFLGCCDIAGAGVVALTSLCLANGLEPIPVDLEDGNAGGAVFDVAGRNGTEKGLPEVMLFNSEKASFIIINTVPSKSNRAVFVASLLKYISSNASESFKSQGCLTIVGALRIRQKMATEGPYSFCLKNDTAKPKFLNGFESLPDNLPIHNSTLAMLLHFCVARGIQTCGLIVPGFKPSSTSPALLHSEGVADLIAALRKAVDLTASQPVDLQARVSWLEEQENSDTLMYC